jgi:hypothetical protein
MSHKPSADEVAAYAAGRADAAAIVRMEAAKGKRAAAMLLAANPSIMVADAHAMLAAMPGKDGAPAPTTGQPGAQSFQQMVDANVRTMLGKPRGHH